MTGRGSIEGGGGGAGGMTAHEIILQILQLLRTS